MKRIIIGTAGHIDHGKTTLVKALTGTDCDRLREEKERGITIELGFARLDLPGGQGIGIVDVPGHEKFIKNMVAGASGIDAVMLIIAADEGVMPQTREHLDICRILAVRAGIVVLTKADMVDAEWLELVSDDVRAFVAGSFLEGAPVVPVSSTNGTGLDTLQSELEALINGLDERTTGGLCRLPVDRVFSMKGFGTVITGTLQAGKIAVGDEVAIMPGNVQAKIRGVQVHGQAAPAAVAGQRTALNFQGIEKERITRGDVVAQPGTMLPTRKAAVWFEHLAGAARPLKNRAPVRFHAGTAELFGRVILLDTEEMPAGGQGFLQLVLDEPAVLLPGDRFVLRSYSPVATIGGGMILDNRPPKHKRLAAATSERLGVLKDGSRADTILLYCREADSAGADFDDLLSRCGLAREELLKQLDRMTAKGLLTAFSKKPLQLTLPETLAAMQRALVDQLRLFHAVNPMKPGMLKEELRGTLARRTSQRLFQHALDGLSATGAIMLQQEYLALPDHRPEVQHDQQETKAALLKLYAAGGLTPPTRKEILEKIDVKEKELGNLLRLLVREETLVKLNDDLYYDAASMHELTDAAQKFMALHGELNIQGFKEVTGLTRKFLIPLFEYFDRTRLTIRMGDKRIPRKSN